MCWTIFWCRYILHAAEYADKNVIVDEHIPVISCLFKFSASPQFVDHFISFYYKIEEFFDRKTIHSLNDAAIAPSCKRH